METTKDQARWAPLAREITAKVMAAFQPGSVTPDPEVHVFNRVLEGLWECAKQYRESIEAPPPFIYSRDELRCPKCKHKFFVETIKLDKKAGG